MPENEISMLEKQTIQTLIQQQSKIMDSELIDPIMVLDHQIKCLVAAIGEGADGWETVSELHRQLTKCIELRLNYHFPD